MTTTHTIRRAIAALGLGLAIVATTSSSDIIPGLGERNTPTPTPRTWTEGNDQPTLDTLHLEPNQTPTPPPALRATSWTEGNGQPGQGFSKNAESARVLTVTVLDQDLIS